MAFSDFPMPPDYPPYARHDQVAAYFEQYVDHFGFRDRITFDTEVIAVERTERASRTLDEGLAPDGWRVTTSGPDGQRTREYAAVIVANGHHWDPRWPEPAYPGDFAGEQIHAHDYRGAEQLQGRDVVVVGSGNSALDIASVAADSARSAAISQRRGQWVIPKFTAGIPTDLITPPGWAPWALTRLRLRIGALLGGSLAPFGLPHPAHAPSQSHPVQSEDIRGALRSGRLRPHRGIRRLGRDRVHFTDGTSAPADLIVWATGYTVSFPFLDPALLAADDNDLPLFHRAVHPDLPGLFFLGLLQPIGAVMPLAEAQAQWSARILRGQYAFPPDGELRETMQRDHERNRRRFYASPRHTMEVDFDRFLVDLRGEMRRGARRAGARAGGARRGGVRRAGTGRRI